MQTLHEPLNFVTGLIRIERAKALWPEMLAAVQAEQAQNESEVASLGKELGIKLD
jgi:hypothetical protein